MPNPSESLHKYKEFDAFESYDTSPFTEFDGIVTAVVKPKDDLLMPVYTEAGDKVSAPDAPNAFVGVKYGGKAITFDKRPYVKIFIDLLDLRELKFSAAGIKMFFFVLKKLRTDKGTVRFTLETARTYTGYSTDKSIYEGLVDLIKMGLLAKRSGTNEEFFVNPKYIFMGNRAAIKIDQI